MGPALQMPSWFESVSPGSTRQSAGWQKPPGQSPSTEQLWASAPPPTQAGPQLFGFTSPAQKHCGEQVPPPGHSDAVVQVWPLLVPPAQRLPVNPRSVQGKVGGKVTLPV